MKKLLLLLLCVPLMFSCGENNKKKEKDIEDNEKNQENVQKEKDHDA